MSKSIYDEALGIMIDSILPRESGKVSKTKVIKALLQAQKQEKLIQKLKSNLISGHFEDKLEHTNKDGSSKNNMYNKGLYDMVLHHVNHWFCSFIKIYICLFRSY